ncbi:MAG: hypothetical protein FJY07_01265 [Bacteroidetes bacterium]|nr:hypothetical protein [Bacteroidota bacterium]
MKQLVRLFALLITVPILGQTTIPGGDVGGLWNSSGSPYLIEGDIYVSGGDTLIIEQGVEVIFQDNFIFNLSGCLLAQGSETDSIRFTEADTSGYAAGADAGWSFNINTDYSNFLSKSIFLDYCVIEYATEVSAFEMAFSNLSISNSKVKNCKSYGLSVFGYSVVNISSSIFTGNKAGGLYLWVTGGSEDIHISNSSISDNIGNGITTAYGGGPVYIDSCIFSGNTASGIIIAPDMPFSVSNSIVENNGNDMIDGGGIAANGNCTMDNVTIKKNKAYNGGGLLLHNTILNEVDISNSTIDSNIAIHNGGGIYGLYPDAVNISSSIISNNASENGSGIYYYLGSYDKTFCNVLICGNHASQKGGGIYIQQNFDLVEFVRTTIADNSADIEGSGLYSELTDIDFNSGIIWGSHLSNVVTSGGIVSISYSNIRNGWPGTGNINANPLFLYPFGKNYHLTWINYPENDYTKSPCIDSGDPSISQDPDTTVADMGAHFFDHSALVQRSLDLKVFLQGPYFGGQMNSDLYTAGILPDQQPYFADPWNHYSSGAKKSLKTNHIVDWLFIEIKKLCDFSDPQKYYVVNRQATYLLQDGSIIAANGGSLPEFYTCEGDSLFASIFHRNHLPVLSSVPLNLTENPVVYDFSVSEHSAQGEFHSQKELSPGLWGMIAGDGNADFQINSAPKNEVWLDQNGNQGYHPGDFNLDGIVNDTDKTGIWDENCGMGNIVSVNEVAPFECGDVIFDQRDGQQYATVQIGSQCWMAENLNIGSRINGLIAQGNNGIIEKYCYDDLDYNCDLYGGFYLWDEMMEYITDTLNQGVCPPNGGWRLPTDFDWKVLEGNVDNQFGVGDPEWDNLYKRGLDAVKNLKSTSGWYSNGNGTDLFGFNALPAGEWDYNTLFKFQHEYAAFFSTTVESEDKAWGRVLGSTFDEPFRGGYYMSYGFSVRCLHE